MNTPRILATFALTVDYNFNPSERDYQAKFGYAEGAPDGLADRQGTNTLRCNGRPGISDVPTFGRYERELVLVDWRNGTSDPLREDEEEEQILSAHDNKVRAATAEEALALAWNGQTMKREYAICVAKGSVFHSMNGYKYVAPLWNGERWTISGWGVWRHQTSERYWLGVKI